MQRLVVLFWIVSSAFVLRAETVLVLPFSNQSNSTNNSTNVDWIGESISEAVRESLVSEGVLALEREDRLEAFRRLSLRSNALLTRASIIKAGEALDASEVVYGHYDLAPASPGSGGGSRGTLRIGARILNLKRFEQGPQLEESGAVEDLAALEARLSWRGLKTLSAKTAPAEEEFLRARPRVRLDALESYIRGLLAANQEQQHRFFMQAARLDTAYSQPCFQLGKSYWSKKDYRVAAGWLGGVGGARRARRSALSGGAVLSRPVRLPDGRLHGRREMFRDRSGQRAVERSLQRPGCGPNAEQPYGGHREFPQGAGRRQRGPGLSLQPGIRVVEGWTVSGRGGQLSRRARKEPRRRGGCRDAQPFRAPGTAASRQRRTRAAKDQL